MKEYFLNYEQALAVKQLGFKENCTAMYFTKNPLYNYDIGELCYSQEGGFLQDFNSENDRVSAPLKSQFFKWIREKYGLHSFVFIFDEGFGYETYKEGVTQTNDSFDTYEQAENACIDKIIELIKNK